MYKRREGNGRGMRSMEIKSLAALKEWYRKWFKWPIPPG
ncbi:paREP2a [Pyrobaculum aerophilum str. IM2]|uniref:PaREP2a n=1 Tax=Pyrobaculum aerophilum (strain ATCC 51768 / DSM 7523 / JCM 9630 / CIP 104966 / NBRC 100827 / IM2) TaxID=178306 RepID=Q8ZX52_PYRAE|nr:paREP2a [Pyrobaculum aerophilum str. IM2]